MDADEPRAKADSALLATVAQDLTPLSLADLDARAALLRREIARIEAHREKVVNHRARADAIFKS